jgi:hypothetical protein
MSAIRNGWQAESYVHALLKKRYDLVVHLGPAFPADILTMKADGDHSYLSEFWEVKSSRVRSKALRGRFRLTRPEEEFATWCLEHAVPFHVVQVQTFPDGHCVVHPPCEEWMVDASSE